MTLHGVKQLRFEKAYHMTAATTLYKDEVAEAMEECKLLDVDITTKTVEKEIMKRAVAAIFALQSDT
jgi:hypothetical protein